MTASNNRNDATQTPSPKKQGVTLSAAQTAAGLLLILVVVFIAENTEHVRVRFIAGPKVSTPAYLALIIAAVVGALVSALLRARRQHRRNR